MRYYERPVASGKCGGPTRSQPKIAPGESATMSQLGAPGRKLPSVAEVLDALRIKPRRRRPTAAELMSMERTDFHAFIATTGLEARIAQALKEPENDAS